MHVMREILVISGKGGTGKTSLTAAFAHLASGAIICDLDVDAPDLHLLLRPQHRQTHEFYAGNEARIDPEICDGCTTCIQMCRFGAIEPGPPSPRINPLKCEGCKVCVQFCPADAILFTPKHCGTWYISQTRVGPMAHAQLFPAQENSGRLVALLRQQARKLAQERGCRLILSDGPPGIGCPVISALSGVHMAVVVTEPTPSGFHDMERVAELCAHFQVPVAVIINKCDLNLQMAEQIETHCLQNGYAVVGHLDYDPDFVHAMVQGQVITEFSAGATAERIKIAWERILALAKMPNLRYEQCTLEPEKPGTSMEEKKTQTTSNKP
jgi:MinD superfamily P-loop ATPase